MSAFRKSLKAWLQNFCAGRASIEAAASNPCAGSGACASIPARGGSDAARFRPKPRFGFRHFRQLIRQHVDAAVHKNPVDNLRGVRFRGVAAYEIGQQIAGK